MVTRDFIDYISTRPLQVEVFGHYQHHPQHPSSVQLPRYSVVQHTVSLLVFIHFLFYNLGEYDHTLILFGVIATVPLRSFGCHVVGAT